MTQVKEKVYRTWSHDDKMRIYGMRRQGVPLDVIAQVYDATRIQIANQIRLARRAMHNECRKCSAPLPARIVRRIKAKGLFGGLCKHCEEQARQGKKRQRQKNLKLGLCGTCGKRRVLKGHTACRWCISAGHRRRYQQNLCGQCGRNPIAEGSIALCEACRIKNNQRAREYRYEHRQVA